MALIQWAKAIVANNSDNLKLNMTPNLTVRGTDAEIDANPNTIRQSFGTNVLRINAGGAVDTGIQFTFNNLEIGDFIEVECEMRSISGSLPLLKIGEWNTTTNVETYPVKKPQQVTGEWKRVRMKTFVTIISSTYNHRAFIGLETGQAGIFELRGVRAIAHTKTHQPQDKIDKGYLKYVIKKTAGVWTLKPYGNSEGTLTIPNTYSLLLEHPARAYATVQISTSKPHLYSIGFTYNEISKLTLDCRIVGDSTSAGTLFENIPDGIEIHITIFYKV